MLLCYTLMCLSLQVHVNLLSTSQLLILSNFPSKPKQILDLGLLWTSQMVQVLVTHALVATSCDLIAWSSFKTSKVLAYLASHFASPLMAPTHWVFWLGVTMAPSHLGHLMVPWSYFWSLMTFCYSLTQALIHEFIEPTFLPDLICYWLLYYGLASNWLSMTHVKFLLNLDVLSSSSMAQVCI
jgi:hypothetical protein